MFLHYFKQEIDNAGKIGRNLEFFSCMDYRNCSDRKLVENLVEKSLNDAI